MQIRTNRKYPVQYKKAAQVAAERSIDVSAATAAGIIAAAFVGGLISGWMIKGRLHWII